MLFKRFLLVAMILPCAVLGALTHPGQVTGGEGSKASLKHQPETSLSQGANLTGHQDALPDKAARDEFQNDLARIEEFRSRNDLDGLVITADELEVKWSRRGGELYGRLMLRISNHIANGFSDERIYSLSQKYAYAALTKADDFSLELETKLLEFLAMDIAPPQIGGEVNSEWARERSTKAKLWLHAWQRFEKELDPNFDFKDVPPLKVVPPLETQMPSGVAPEAIKDSKLRAEYEANIAANEEKARKFNQQYRLRLTGEYLPKQAEQYLISVYGRPPYNLEELRVYLNEYLKDGASKERIINEVKKKIRQESAGVADPL